MLGLSGAMVFGLIAGYLSWRGAYQGEPGGRLFYRRIASFAGAVAGGAIMAVFLARCDMFASYCLGVGAGFCFSTVHRCMSRSAQSLWRRRLQKRQQREDRRVAATLSEIERVETEWLAIEGIIQNRLKRPHRSVQVQELPELRVGYRAKFYAMRKFAKEHSHDGVALDAHGGIFGLPVLRQRKDGATTRKAGPTSGGDKSRLGDGNQPPLAWFSTTYVLGDDRYDRSFVIETRNGEFIGECGVDIWETIGMGSPRRVTAFEVWLFDKEDIRTVAGVLMSDHAFHDTSLHLKATFRGDAVLIEEGRGISLSTETLHLHARITRAVYGTGDVLPNSFFEKLTAELEVWHNPRPTRGDGISTEEHPGRT